MDYKSDQKYIEAFNKSKEIYKRPSAYRSLFIFKYLKQYYPDFYQEIQIYIKKNKVKSSLKDWIKKEKWMYYDRESDSLQPCGSKESVEDNYKICRPLNKGMNAKITWNDLKKKYGSYKEADRILRQMKMKSFQLGKIKIKIKQ